ncbi:hypothetical protein LCGC14_2273010 [marine sediment metagenome]|uniref:Nuclease associated modular domain-containing protein n=1 Tax=marine sediment metagenome TaxID=412755 RepID=A0A0F9CWJ2_9ZZZZ
MKSKLEQNIKHAVEVKQCSQCNEIKALSYFNKRYPIGKYRTACKDCAAKSAKRNYDKRRQRGSSKKCLQCGKNVKTDANRFCSSSCSNFYRGYEGENHPRWVGDNISYCGVHSWMNKNFKKSPICNFCKKTPKKGRDGRTNLEWANVSGKYLRDRSDWIILCCKCHKEYDRETYKHRRRAANGQYASN